MFTVDDIRAEYQRLDRKFNIDTSKCEITPVTSMKRMGCVHFNRPGSKNGLVRKITFSRLLFEQPKEFFYDVIRHEYAHVLVQCRFPNENHGHDDIWKAACYEVGCSATRLYQRDESLSKAVKNAAKYQVTCNFCGATFYYLKAGSVVKALKHSTGSCTCKGCGHSDFILKILR